jgi:ABC-type branched-subunit amino acid transport system ATPase component
MQEQEGAAETRRDPAASVRGLRKTYGGVEAVAGIDLEIRRDEMFALLGPNGAGPRESLCADAALDR